MTCCATRSSVVATRYWHPLDDGRVQCDLCPRFCKLRVGQRGLCFVRARRDDEIARWRHATRIARPLRGYPLLWGSLDRVRDIDFDRVEPVRVGRMTAGLD